MRIALTITVSLEECRFRVIQSSTRVENNSSKKGKVDDFGWPQSGACGMENGKSNWSGLAFPSICSLAGLMKGGAEVEHRTWGCI